jgi:low affinity Fe/Cu permease
MPRRSTRRPTRSPRRKSPQTLGDRFRSGADTVTRVVGTPWAMLAAVLVVLVWAVTGPMFGFSDTWQLVINTGTTIVTFLMVFAIQTSQNRDATALHLKIDELISSQPNARNRLMAEELANEAEVEEDERSMLKRAEHGGDDRRERRDGRRNGRRRSSARRSPGEGHN